jgi:YD repeat-containing protein
MVAIFAGAGAGVARGSERLLGAAGLLGSGTLGRSGQNVSVNAATGNLLIGQLDESLVGRGLDASIARTYNSLAQTSDGDNGDNWQQSSWRRVYGLTGSQNTAGSTITRQGGDGSAIVYSWKTVDGVTAYWSTDGDGAHDKLVKSGSTWIWTDGSSRITETYEASYADSSSFRIKEQTDTGGYKLAFAYVASSDKLYRVTTANHGTANASTGVPEQSYLEYVWSGNTITQIITGYTDYGDPTTAADNLNKVLSRTWYDYSGGKLIRVRTDLTPSDNSLPSLADSYWTEYGYDASGRVNLITEKDGASLAIAYDGSGRVQTLTQTVASGDTRVTGFVYGLHDAGDPANVNYTSITGADNQVTKLYADDKGQLVKITTPLSYGGAPVQTTRFAYDADGNLTSVTDADGKITSFTYDADGNKLTDTDSMGNVVTRTYGTKNELKTETRIGSDAAGPAVSHTTRYAYDSYNQLRYAVSAEGYVTEYRYTPYGELQYVVEYPEHGYPVGATDITETALDSWRNLITDRSSTKMVDYVYDGRGNLYCSTTYGIATAGGAVSASEGYGRAWARYDQAGRLLSRNADGENAETFVYDGMGRLIGSTDLAGGTTTIVFNDAATMTTVTNALGYTSVSTYNKAGELISESHSGADDVTGTSTYKYDKNGRVRMMTDATGANRYFLYDKAGRKIADISHTGELTEYRYDIAGRVAATVSYTNVVALTGLSDPNSVIEISTIRPAALGTDVWAWSIYDAAGRVIETIDGDGGVTTYQYDGSDRLVKTVGYFNKLSSVSGYKTTPPTAQVLPTADANRDSVSRTFYDRDDRLIGKLDGEGYLSEVVYDKAGQKIEEIGYAGRTSSTYWAAGTFTELRGSAGPASTANLRKRYVYDGQGLLRYTVDNAGYPISYSYNTAGKLTKTIVHAAAISTADFTYDNVKTLVAAITSVPNDRLSRITYNAQGQVATTVDVTGLTTAFTYNSLGTVVKTVVGSGGDARTTRNWYSAGGDLRFTIDAEGYVRRFDYDSRSRVTREVAWANRVTASDSTTFAQIQSLANAAGGWVDANFAYDTSGRRYSVIDGLGNETRYSWNAHGTLSSVYSAYGTADQSRTHYVYDGAGRVVSETRAYGEPEAAVVQYAYDGLGNRASVIDANNKTTTYTFDERGQVLTATDAAGGVSTFEYDAFGQVVKITDPRLNASYNYYDNFGRLVKSRDAESYVTEKTYNAFGEVATVTRYYNRTTSAVSTVTQPSVTPHANDSVTVYTYDKRGMVTSARDANNATEYFGYDAFGNRITHTNKIGGQIEYTFDKLGQILTERVQHTASLWVTTSFEYDARGNRTKTIEGNGLSTTISVFDKANRVIEIIGQAFQGLTPHSYLAYDGRGNLTRATDAAGAKTFYFYDDLNRKTVEIDALGTYRKLSYDANGNVIEARVYETAVTLPADGGSEEEAPVAPGGASRSTSFTYDNLNRVLTNSISGVKTGSWNGSTWVTSTAPITVAYQYDAGGNVVKTTSANGNTTWIYYDSLGRKTTQVDSERYRIDWTYDNEGHVLSETRSANQVAAPSSTTTPPSVTPNATFDRTTNYSYDKVGNRLTEQRMGVLVHNGSGGTTTVNALNRFWYNALGQVIQRDDATDAAAYGVVGDESTYYTYDLAGRLDTERRAAFVAANGATVIPQLNYAYDALDNLLSTAQVGQGDAATRTTSYVYDGGKLVSMTDASGFAHYYKYDIAGRVTHDYYTRLKSDGTAVAAYEGSLKTYDALGRVWEQWQATSANGSSWTAVVPVVSTRYNAFGEIAKIGINAAGVAEGSKLWQEQNQYDGAGRLWATNSGDGVWKYLGYDKNGNQTVAITSAGANLTGKTFDQALALVGGNDVNATYTTYDGRGLATSIVEEGRQVAGGVQTLSSTRSYNAFGQVTSESNALGATIGYSYNSIGKLIRRESPTVSITLEDGGKLWVKPSEDYYYDAAGRLVATRDANGSYAAGGTSTTGTSKAANTGNLTRMTLLAGTGYRGSGALVTAETHADGGVKQTRYDIHGDARTLIDELGQQTTQVFDAMGRVTSISRPGGLIESFGYDGLGQRIQAWNNLYQTPIYGTPVEVWVEDPPYWNAYDQAWEYGNGHYEWQSPIIGYTPDKARTDYDAMGRVISTRAFGGDVITTSYSWDATIGASGTGITSGGWTETDTYYFNDTTATGKSSTEKTDLFGRATWKSDLGAHVTTFAYDVAGRQVTTTLGGMTSSFTYYNTGRLASIATGSATAGQVNTSWTRDTTNYSYDAAGSRLSELMVHEEAVYTPAYTYWYNPYEPEYVPESYDVYSETIKNSTATYDALGRMKSWAEAGNARLFQSTLAYEYDANSNIRRTVSTYYSLDYAGAGFQWGDDHWFRFDTMNRVVTDKGMLTGAAGAAGTTIARWNSTGYSTPGTDIQYDLAGRRAAALSTDVYYDGYGGYTGSSTVTETYEYNTQGLLWRVQTNTDGAGAKTRSTFGYDLLGHQTSQSDYDTNGTTVVYSRSMVFNTKGQMSSDSTWTKKTDNKTYSSSTSYYFTAYSGGQYLLGSVGWSQSSNSVTGGSMTTSRTINGYIFYDSALQSSINYDSDINSSSNPVYNTYLNYNGMAQLLTVNITDGKPRTVTFTNDELGQVLRRDETRPSNAPSSQAGSPHEIWYRFNGRQMGFTGNNGTDDMTMAASIADRRVVAPTNQGTFRNAQHYASSAADFTQSLDPINSFSQGSAGGSYTVRSGDTLSSIASAIYGDGSLWYKIAEANGLSSASALFEGQTLTLPTGVLKNTYNANSFKPYDAAEAIGDVSPTTAPKPPKQNKCGSFGLILLAVVALAVATIVTAGVASVATGATFGNALGAIFAGNLAGLSVAGGAALGTAGAIGAGVAGAVAGSIVSQGIGVATGIQAKFSWKNVAMAGIGSLIGGSITGIFGKAANAFGAAAQAAAGSAITQGIGVATGLQDKFSWAGVAAAGVGAGVGFEVGNRLAQGGIFGITAAGSSFGNFAASTAASAIANAATRSAINGESFGDNLIAALPDVIAQLLQRAIGNAYLSSRAPLTDPVRGMTGAGPVSLPASASPDFAAKLVMARRLTVSMDPSVTPADLDLVANELAANRTGAELELLLLARVPVGVTVNSVGIAKPSLNAVASTDNAGPAGSRPGLYEPNSITNPLTNITYPGAILISVNHLPGGGTQIATNHGSNNLVLHESGHALDDILRRPSHYGLRNAGTVRTRMTEIFRSRHGEPTKAERLQIRAAAQAFTQWIRNTSTTLNSSNPGFRTAALADGKAFALATPLAHNTIVTAWQTTPAGYAVLDAAGNPMPLTTAPATWGGTANMKYMGTDASSPDTITATTNFSWGLGGGNATAQPIEAFAEFATLNRVDPVRAQAQFPNTYAWWVAQPGGAVGNGTGHPRVPVRP